MNKIKAASILMFSFLILSCGNKKTQENNIEYRKGIAYEKYSSKPYTGTVFVQDTNGKILLNCSFLEGREDGVFKTFYPSGATKSEVLYKNGKEEGSYKSYYENGVMEEEGNFSNGLENGVFIGFYENGNISIETNFKNGIKEGKEIRYYGNGREKMIFFNEKGEKNGVLVEYFPGGEIKRIENYKSGVLNGVQSYFNLENKVAKVVAKYENGLENGNTLLFDKEGRVLEENNFVFGKKSGVQRRFLYQPDKEKIPSKILKHKIAEFIDKNEVVQYSAHFDYNEAGEIITVVLDKLNKENEVLKELNEGDIITTDEYNVILGKLEAELIKGI